MIVVYPDEIVGLRTAADGFRVAIVNLFVSLPVCRIEVAEILQIVKQRPDHLVGITVVKFVPFGFTQGYRHCAWPWSAVPVGFCRRFPASQSRFRRARAVSARSQRRVRL